MSPSRKVIVDVDGVRTGVKSFDGQSEGHDITLRVGGVVSIEVPVLPATGRGLVSALVEVDVQAPISTVGLW